MRVNPEQQQRLYAKLCRELGPTTLAALADADVTEVMCNPDGSLWIESHGQGMRETGDRLAQTQVESLIGTVAALLGTVVHVDRGFPTRIGRRVTIGHRCVVHGCTVEDGALVGMGAVLLSGSRFGAGALVAAERNERAMWALHAGFLAEEVVPTVPAPVLAEAWRGGGRQASLSRLLAMCDAEALSEDQARRVGVLAGNAAHPDIVDVSVVEGAARRHDAVVTSNATHIRTIAEAAGARLHIEHI